MSYASFLEKAAIKKSTESGWDAPGTDDWGGIPEERNEAQDWASVNSDESYGSRGFTPYYTRECDEEEPNAFEVDETKLAAGIKTEKDGPIRSPLRSALSLLRKMGSTHLPKSKKALKRALKPACTVVAYTPLSIVLEKLKKLAPDLFDVQYAVLLGEKKVKRLSNVEQDVLDLALSKATKDNHTCPVQIALPFTKRGQEMQEEIAKSTLLTSGDDVSKHMSALMELCIREEQIHPERVLLQYLLTSSFIIADSELEFFRVTRCCNPNLTKQALLELNAAYVKAAKLHIRECRNGDMKQHEISMHALQYTKTQKSAVSASLDGRLKTLRPEAVPALFHLLTLVENKPENIFSRSEILEEISNFCRVMYVCSPVVALGFRCKEDRGAALTSQFGRDPQKRPTRRNGSLYDPVVSSSHKSLPQFVTLHYDQLLPMSDVRAQRSTSWRQSGSDTGDMNMESRHTLREYTLKHVKELCKKRGAGLVVNNEKYGRAHVTKLQALLRGLEVPGKVHESDVCRMIFTGMTRANFLRRMLYCCFSVHSVDPEDLVLALKEVHKIREEEGEVIKYNY